jgi:hypothetical protein
MTDAQTWRAEQYRLLQARELMLRFEEAHGRPSRTLEELRTWVRISGFAKPITPRPELWDDEFGQG